MLACPKHLFSFLVDGIIHPDGSEILRYLAWTCRSARFCACLRIMQTRHLQLQHCKCKWHVLRSIEPPTTDHRECLIMNRMKMLSTKLINRFNNISNQESIYHQPMQAGSRYGQPGFRKLSRPELLSYLTTIVYIVHAYPLDTWRHVSLY